MPRSRFAALLAALGFAASGPAAAENPSPLPEWVYSAGVPLMPRFMDEIPKWQVTLGISDVPPGQEAALASGPTLPDPSTSGDACRTVERSAVSSF